MSESIDLPETTVTTKPREQTRQQTRRLPPFNVILENDDFHTMGFVVDVLRKALCLTEQKAVEYMSLAHRTGRAIVWTGAKEHAELKAEQIQSFHEISDAGAKFGPLGVSIEPAE